MDVHTGREEEGNDDVAGAVAGGGELRLEEASGVTTTGSCRRLRGWWASDRGGRGEALARARWTTAAKRLQIGSSSPVRIWRRRHRRGGSRGDLAGRIWIDPEEGGDLFERSGWAGGEIEEKVGGRIRQIPRKSGGGARVGSLEIRVWSKNGHGGLYI